MSDRPQEIKPSSAHDAADLARTRHAYLAALLRADPEEAQRTVDVAIAAGLPVSVTYLEVLAPALAEVGALWERAEISVGDEHVATAITQGVLATLSTRLPRVTPPDARPVAVVGCGAGDFHGVGVQMVSDFLLAAGWRTLPLGAATPAVGFADVAAQHGATLVAVSTSRAEHLDGVRDVRKALDRLESPPIMAVGGLAYLGHPERVAAVGADLYAADPAELVRLLGRGVPR